MKRTIQDIAYFILPLSLQLLVWAFIHLSWMGSTDYVLLSALLLVCFLLILSDFACFVVVISHIIKDGSNHKLKLLLLTIFLKPSMYHTIMRPVSYTHLTLPTTSRV